MFHVTNPESILGLTTFLNNKSPEVLRRLQDYSVHLNRSSYHRDDKGVQEIAETIKKLITGENLSLMFAGRLITAYEEALKQYHYEDKTLLMDDILDLEKSLDFDSYKNLEIS